MAAKVNLHLSSLGIKYPQNRDHRMKSSDTWLGDRRHDDGAEGLWRIHDDLYDLTDFIDKHPGGQDWLKLTQGTDITEAFEAHHISTHVEHLLPKFQIRKATSKRNYPFLFEENGFYRTLKRNVREALKTIPKSDQYTNMYTDGSLVLALFFSILAAKFWSFKLAVIAAAFLTFTVIASHNYFHKRDNFRMYYFDLSFMSSRDWRISHVLSHHLYPNTVVDMEISMLEPLFEYMPKPKSMKYLRWIVAIMGWFVFYHMSVIKRHVLYYKGKSTFRKAEFIPYALPLIMYLFSGQQLLATLFMWQCIVLMSSIHFGFVGTNAAHHHPQIFHDGDTPRPKEELDWGLHQLDSVMDRVEINGNLWLVLTNFGDHGLHHLFPTLDHSTLYYLYPIFEETCKEFNIHLRILTQFQLIKGQFAQLIRSQPNPYPPYSDHSKTS